MVNLTKITSLLSDWALQAERHWYPLPNVSGLGCYGTGYNAWGVQTNQKYVSALTALAMRKDQGQTDWVSREWALERALSALRFSLASHLSGELTCTDGTRWGHTWISALGLERMYQAIYLLEPHLMDEDQEAIRRVLASEADWLLQDYQRGQVRGVVAGLWDKSGRNQPESNIWNGALLWRAAASLPAHAHASDWQEKAHQFLINAVSIPADGSDATIIAGKPVRERFLGANFFPHYALDHHGYFNVGYMVICMSNAAMLHFDLKMKGLPRPETLDRHQADLWQVVRRLVFQNGRLARIGGDSRVRYAYCQEYLLPALLYAADRFQDSQALTLAGMQLKLIEEEASFGKDGSFYGRRLANLERESEYYYTRLESDRACALAQVLAYAPLVSSQKDEDTDLPETLELRRFEESVAGTWQEPEHGDVLHRSAKRLASFSWRAQGLAQGMCQSPEDGHLTDWEGHLCGQVALNHHPHPLHPNLAQRKLGEIQIRTFSGGFLTYGSLVEGAEVELAEGWRGHDLANHWLAFAALPDDQTVLAIEFCRLGKARAMLRRVTAMHFNLVNDLYNRFVRTLRTDQDTFELASPVDDPQNLTLGARAVCVDNRLGLIGIHGADSFSVRRSPVRGAGPFQSLYVEEISWGDRQGPFWADPGALVLDSSWAVLASADWLRTMRASETAHHHPVNQLNLRLVSIQGADQRLYLLAASFQEENKSLSFPEDLSAHSWTDLVTGQAADEIDLPAYQARFYRSD